MGLLETRAYNETLLTRDTATTMVMPVSVVKSARDHDDNGNKNFDVNLFVLASDAFVRTMANTTCDIIANTFTQRNSNM